METAGSWYPFFVLAIGISVVLGSIVLLRVNAFIALLSAALVVSFLVGAEIPDTAAALTDPVVRVVDAFGATAGAIGIVIALAAVIGEAMMRSGAADRIVRAFLAVLGEKRGATAMMSSGFVLSVPVFFDTAFYLLVPLARSLYKTTGRHYLKYLVAIAAGGVATHAIVPPTPGPLFVANVFDVNLGAMIVLGAVIALPAATAGLLYGVWLDRRMPLAPGGEEAAESRGDDAAPAPAVDERRLPGLTLSLLPILLPILLITGNAVVKTLAQQELIAADAEARLLRGGALNLAILQAGAEGSRLGAAFRWTNVLGNPNLALFLSGVISIATLWTRRRFLDMPIPRIIETALMSGGIIILITAAGGAFGGTLRAAGLGDAIRHLAEAQVAGGGAPALLSGLPLLGLAFAVASLIKFAQGSSTTAMIVTSGMIVAMINPTQLTFHPAYLVAAIGAGSLVGSWMNDSGFWIFAKMGGLTEVQTLKSWTPALVIVGSVAFVLVVILAGVLPLAGP
ncbi:MAG: GntP family permease [Acidobacteria bacterium]|nr:GntP family permease [Acidobacteriota bacterium]